MKNQLFFLLTLSLTAFLTLATSCASTPPKPPAWVASPNEAYPQSRYITAVGTGHDRTEAERNALAALVAIFGQSVQTEMSTVVTYSKAVADGAVNMSEDRRKWRG
ncbi:hypothetical protein AGMMS49942_27450 [Spirochaetia bacterium]|nr:hypothetical protein AGMMS49942_27450 [Spirochaetia bacterium]